MKHLYNIVLTLLLFSFFLPFFPMRCGRIATYEEEMADNAPKIDTVIIKDSSAIAPAAVSMDSVQKETVREDTLNKEDAPHPLVELLILPDKKNHSGIGFLVENFHYDVYLIVISLLVVIVLILSRFNLLKFIRGNEVYLACTALAANLIIVVKNFQVLKWGFWTCLSLYVLVLVIQLVKKKKGED